MFRRRKQKSEASVVITLGERITIVRNGFVEAKFGYNEYRCAGDYLGEIVGNTLEWMAGEGNRRLECNFDRR